MTECKKAWVEPELIVLVRNQPEESVMTAYKTASETPIGSGSNVVACMVPGCGVDCLDSLMS